MKELPLPPGSRWTTTGRFTRGVGRASVVAATDQRRRIMRRFSGAPLVGTFNIRCRDRLSGSPVAYRGDGLSWRHVVLEHTAGERYGWAMVQRRDPTILECFTKVPLPEEFRNDEIRVTVLRHWSDHETKRWARQQFEINGHRWWQTWPWLPRHLRRGASARIWEVLKHEAWEGATVLDFGCNEGYFATRCARAGAIVTGIDKNPLSLSVARSVNAHIEGTDVTFARADEPPDGTWDIVLSLSVLHQSDPAYDRLTHHVEKLRHLARRAIYLELMTPPLAGALENRQVDARVGGEKLISYRHPVRRTRSLYRVVGQAR